MALDWERLSEVVRRLKLPAGVYAVGRVGYGLSRDRASTADRAELLVDETGWRRLKERGWQERGGGSVLRHPKERDLSARMVRLEDVRHEIVEVDGVPVIAVEPDPPATETVTARQRWGTAITGVLLTIVVAVVVYGWAMFFPTPEAASMRQHLTFETRKVEATVERSAETGTCQGAEVWESGSPRITVTLTWTEDGQEKVASYTGCGASVDSPQDVWVTAEDEVASQHSPWVDHLWPALIVGLVPFAFFVMPIVDRLRALWWRRRRG